MPTQSEVNPEGPQNILGGSITLNDDVVHDGWAQYDELIVEDWLSELEHEPLTDLHFGR